MLTRVGKILGAVVLFLLAFFPVQIVILASLSPSPSSFFWITATTISLSLLLPTWVVYFFVRADPELAKITLRMLIGTFGGLAVVIPLLALIRWILPYGPYIPVPDIGNPDMQVLLGVTLYFIVHILLFFLAFIGVPALVSLTLADLWAKTARGPDRVRSIRRRFWILIPLYLAGLTSLPLYVGLYVIGRAFGSQ